jgi:hypothetical protein
MSLRSLRMSRLQRATTTYTPTRPHRQRYLTTPSESPRSAPGSLGPHGRIESSYLPRSPLPEFVRIFYLAVKVTRKTPSHIFSAISDAVGVSAADSPTRGRWPHFRL